MSDVVPKSLADAIDGMSPLMVPVVGFGAEMIDPPLTSGKVSLEPLPGEQLLPEGVLEEQEVDPDREIQLAAQLAHVRASSPSCSR